MKSFWRKKITKSLIGLAAGLALLIPAVPVQADAWEPSIENQGDIVVDGGCWKNTKATEYTSYDSSDTYYRKRISTFENDGKIERSSYYYGPDDSSGGVCVREFDDKGNILKETWSGSGFDSIYSYECEYEYNEKGDVIKKTRPIYSLWSMETKISETFYEYEYDDQGRQIKVTSGDTYSEYEYNNYGIKWKEVVHDKYGSYTYFLDRSGNRIEDFPDGEFEYTYEANGDLSRLDYSDDYCSGFISYKNGYPVWVQVSYFIDSDVSVRETVYDDDGKKIRESSEFGDVIDYEWEFYSYKKEYIPEDAGEDVPEGYEVLFRFYNPNSGEHFYTTKKKEGNKLVDAGWIYEGEGWTAPTSGDPVYRLYNKNAGDHHYTTSEKEKNKLIKAGWTDEGIGWYSEPEDTGKPLYRLYNPNATGAGSHHYTTSTRERDKLVQQGWNDEGIAWYGLAD